MISMNENKSAKIQSLRGLAIIAVVLIHTTPGGMPQVLYRPFLNIPVGLFLFLSGMLSDSKKWNPCKRIAKILVPYAIWTFLYILIVLYKSPEKIFRNYLYCLISGKASTIMYYVFVYCELTLLIPLIDRLARSRFKYLGFIISPLEIICMRMIPMLFEIPMNRYISNVTELSCLCWFTYFYLGYLLGNKCIPVNRRPQTMVGLWEISLFIQMAEGYWYYSRGIANCGTQVKLTALLSGSLFCIMSYMYIEDDSRRNSAFLTNLGNSSFGIYFSHLFILQLLWLIPGYSEYVIFPLNAIILVAVSWPVVLAGHKILGKKAKYVAF